MPIARKIFKMSTYSSAFKNNEAALFTDIDGNPGTTQADIVTRTGISVQVVSDFLVAADQMGIVERAADLAGLEHFWAAGDWDAVMRGNLGAARTWLDANDGGTESDLATGLAVYSDARDEVLARRYSAFFEIEASGRAVFPAV